MPVLRSPTLRSMALVAAALATILAAWPGHGRTQDAAFDETVARAVSGSWTLSLSAERAQAVLEEAITRTVADLPPLVDSIAARQLRERIRISRTLTLNVTATRIETRFSYATFDTVPGVPTRTTLLDDPSSSMEVVQLIRSGHLEQIFTTDSGRRWNTLTPSADGSRLTLEAVVHSDRLPTDLRFHVDYRRSG